MKFKLQEIKGINHAHEVECITTEGTYTFTDCILIQQKDSKTLTIVERPHQVHDGDEVITLPSLQHAIGLEFCVKMKILRDIKHTVLIDGSCSLWRLHNEDQLPGEDSRSTAQPKA